MEVSPTGPLSSSSSKKRRHSSPDDHIPGLTYATLQELAAVNSYEDGMDLRHQAYSSHNHLSHEITGAIAGQDYDITIKYNIPPTIFNIDCVCSCSDDRDGCCQHIMAVLLAYVDPNNSLSNKSLSRSYISSGDTSSNPVGFTVSASPYHQCYTYSSPHRKRRIVVQSTISTTVSSNKKRHQKTRLRKTKTQASNNNNDNNNNDNEIENEICTTIGSNNSISRESDQSMIKNSKNSKNNFHFCGEKPSLHDSLNGECKDKETTNDENNNIQNNNNDNNDNDNDSESNNGNNFFSFTHFNNFGNKNNNDSNNNDNDNNGSNNTGFNFNFGNNNESNNESNNGDGTDGNGETDEEQDIDINEEFLFGHNNRNAITGNNSNNNNNNISEESNLNSKNENDGWNFNFGQASLPNSFDITNDDIDGNNVNENSNDQTGGSHESYDDTNNDTNDENEEYDNDNDNDEDTPSAITNTMTTGDGSDEMKTTLDNEELSRLNDAIDTFDVETLRLMLKNAVSMSLETAMYIKYETDRLNHVPIDVETLRKEIYKTVHCLDSETFETRQMEMNLILNELKYMIDKEIDRSKRGNCKDAMKGLFVIANGLSKHASNMKNDVLNNIIKYTIPYLCEAMTQVLCLDHLLLLETDISNKIEQISNDMSRYGVKDYANILEFFKDANNV